VVTFVLIHSPLVGPLTWMPVADELRQMDFAVVVPVLRTGMDTNPPYWKHHAGAVARGVEPVSPDHFLILVGHSGAGVLLPAVRHTIDRPVAAYIFVDADIPRDGASRLDLFGTPEEAAQFRQAATGGLLPAWSEEDLRGAIENAELRRRFVAELRLLPLAVYEEPLPVFAGWPDAPCGYLQFSPTYEAPAAHARQKGWPCIELDGGHFHMLAEPPAVANALIDLVQRTNMNHSINWASLDAGCTTSTSRLCL